MIILSKTYKRNRMSIYNKILDFYINGFKSMKLGKSLWKLIIIKVLLIFAIAYLFFPNILETRFDTDQERSDYVINNLTGGR